MNFILFNGPPGCGKDTAARYLYDLRYGPSMTTILPQKPKDPLPGTWRFDRFSMPIKRAFHATFGGTLDPYGNNYPWESYKDEPNSLLNGKTYRNWQQDFSEALMKPHYGRDIFARLLVSRHEHRAHDRNYSVLIPDTGFLHEVVTLRSHFPTASILLMRIERDGFTFEGDTRSYIDPAHDLLIEAGGVSFDVIRNREGEKEAFETEIESRIRSFLGAS